MNQPEITRKGFPVLFQRIGRVSFILIILALVVSNVLLIKQNREFRSALAKNNPEYLKQGERIPNLNAHGKSGEDFAIDFAGNGKTILFIYGAGCVVCEKAIPYWKKIEDATSGGDYRSFAIGIGDSVKAAAFISTTDIKSKQLFEVDREMREILKISFTPMTIVIDNNGIVEQSWPGAISGERKTEIERYFETSLDG